MSETQLLPAQANGDHGIVGDALLAKGERFPECAAVAGQTAGDRNSLTDDAGDAVDQCAAVDLYARAKYQNGLQVCSEQLLADSLAGGKRVLHAVERRRGRRQ